MARIHEKADAVLPDVIFQRFLVQRLIVDNQSGILLQQFFTVTGNYRSRYIEPGL